MYDLTANRWDARALCAEVDTEIFFPKKGRQNKHAKALCGRCEVRLQCLTEALDNPELVGIWGGTSYRERQAMRAQERAA